MRATTRLSDVSICVTVSSTLLTTHTKPAAIATEAGAPRRIGLERDLQRPVADRGGSDRPVRCRVDGRDRAVVGGHPQAATAERDAGRAMAEMDAGRDAPGRRQRPAGLAARRRRVR